MTTSYAEFLATKRRPAPSSGIDCTPDQVDPSLFDFQRHIVAWAVRRGRAAVWTATGTGKTRIQVAWADRVTRDGGRALILCPLAVAEQTIREAAKIGVDVAYTPDQDHMAARINITNYERLHKFPTVDVTAVVLDESSILKAYSGVTKRALVARFRDTPYRLALSATPAPNDIEELCNHADFLGVMSPAEMRSTFFIADSRGEFMKYRLKGHAETAFYDWLASWAIACRTPDDLGFDGSAYQLPPLRIVDHYVPTEWAADGELFTPVLAGVTQRAQVRRDTVTARVQRAAGLIRSEPDRSWLAWCGRNDEQDQLAAALGDQAASIDGRTEPDGRLKLERAWRDGEYRVLVTKPTVFGWGMNWQHCDRMVFVGLGDSFEQYHQAIRRCWRYGQTRPVQAHIVLTDVEAVIADNVRAKERTAASTTTGLVAAIAENNRRDLFAGTSKGDSYEPSRQLTVPHWLTTEAQ